MYDLIELDLIKLKVHKGQSYINNATCCIVVKLVVSWPPSLVLGTISQESHIKDYKELLCFGLPNTFQIRHNHCM